jgi:uncharacterized membrane protein
MQQLNAPGVRWEWIGEAWNLFTKQWSAWVLMVLVMYLIAGVTVGIVYGVCVLLIGVIVAAVGSDLRMDTGGLALLFNIVMLAPTIVALGNFSWLGGGMFDAAFKQLRGEQITINNLFSGARSFTRLLGALLLVQLPLNIASIILNFIFPGLSLILFIPLLIIPGLAFFTAPMIVEGGKGAIDAIKASIEVTKQNLVMFIIFGLAVGIIAFSGAIACGVGLLVTLPLLFLTQALAYRDVVGDSVAQTPGQYTPTTDYGYYTPEPYQTPAAPPDYRSYTPTPSPAPPAPSQPQSWEAPTFVSPAAPETPSMTCPHCGAVLARMLNFCNQCGRPLRSA